LKFNNERELQEDLAKYLRECGYLTYTEIEIKGGRGGRADVVAVKPSYANKDCRIYEVKNNRAAFDRDTKYEKYLDVCHRMFIACPKGMIAKDELPPKIGLIVKGENGWYVVKSPRRNIPKDFNIDFVLSLLYHGYEETQGQRKLRDHIIAKDNVALNYRAKNIGYEIARRLDRDRETQVEEWILKVAKLFEKYMGIPAKERFDGLPSVYDIEHILRGSRNYEKELSNLRRIGEYICSLEHEEDGMYSGLGIRREKALEAIGNA